MPPKRPPGTGYTPPKRPVYPEEEEFPPLSEILPDKPPDEGRDPHDTSTIMGWIRYMLSGGGRKKKHKRRKTKTRLKTKRKTKKNKRTRKRKRR